MDSHKVEVWFDANTNDGYSYSCSISCAKPDEAGVELLDAVEESGITRHRMLTILLDKIKQCNPSQVRISFNGGGQERLSNTTIRLIVSGELVVDDLYIGPKEAKE